MSLSHAPYVVTNGLVFAYDQNNIRSYKGPPVQNLANNISIATYSATGFTATPSTQVEQIPGVGLVTTYRSTIQNNYNAFTPNSTDCCPSLHTWGNFSVTPSTLYTYLILYKCDSEYTTANYMYRYEYASNGGAYVTEGGVHSTTNRVSLGGGWYYAWGTFTTQATTNWLGHCATFYYRYSNVADRLTVAKVAIIAGNYSGLHPKYWPNQALTRSNTQTILDLTNNNTVTATSLTYASDGTISFNGSSNRLNPPINHSYLNSSALEVVFRSTSHGTGNKTIFGYSHNQGYSLPTIGSLYLNNNTLSAAVITAAQAYRVATVASPIATNTFYHVVLNKNTTTGLLEIYVNGVLGGSQTFDAATYGQWTTAGNFIGANLLDIGKSTNMDAGQGWSTDYFSGTIPIAKVYNRVLSQSEIQQNFQALRGRFGL